MQRGMDIISRFILRRSCSYILGTKIRVRQMSNIEATPFQKMFIINLLPLTFMLMIVYERIPGCSIKRLLLASSTSRSGALLGHGLGPYGSGNCTVKARMLVHLVSTKSVSRMPHRLSSRSMDDKRPWVHSYSSISPADFWCSCITCFRRTSFICSRWTICPYPRTPL